MLQSSTLFMLKICNDFFPKFVVTSYYILESVNTNFTDLGMQFNFKNLDAQIKLMIA